MKRLAFLLVFALAFMACGFAEELEDLQLPDIGVLLGVEGELYGTSQEESGPYHTYIYEVNMTVEEAADVIVTYTQAATETGFTFQNNEIEGALIKYMSFSSQEGMADLALFVAGDGEALASGEEGLLWFALAVPDSMAFELGDGGQFLVEGGMRCAECGGSGRCAYCLGTGADDYGEGLEDCIICEGSGICNICGGEGKY